jgi:hypothetical protein
MLEQIRQRKPLFVAAMMFGWGVNAATQTTEPKLDPQEAYCHGMVETLVLFGAPFDVSFDDCLAMLVEIDFEGLDLIGPLMPGQEP